MQKKRNEQSVKRKKRSETASVVASISGRTPRLVNMVMNGEVDNEEILTATILYEQGKNALIQEIKRIVRFN